MGDMANGDVYDVESIMHYHSSQDADLDFTCTSYVRQAGRCPLSLKVDVSEDGKTFRRGFVDPHLQPSGLDVKFVKTFYPYKG